MKIKFPAPSKIVIPKHTQLFNLHHEIVLLWGGRFGGKSESLARYLTIECLRSEYFRCVLARKVFNTVEDSQYQTIKDFVFQTGLGRFFNFKKSPLKIECINGNSFICRGFDKPEKIKSIKDPTHFWYEEMAESDEKDFETAITTLRSKHKMQFFGTFNPETDVDINEFWLYKKFFEGQNKRDFETSLNIELENNTIQLNTISIHTTYKDNPYLTNQHKAIVEKYRAEFEKNKSQIAQYYYKVWTLGEWGNRQPELQFLYNFSEILHLKQLKYIDEVLHISIDKNVNPYLPASVWQIQNDIYYQVDEIILEHPNNRTRILAQKIVEICREIQNNNVFLYGDATAKADDTNQEVGSNFYTIIESILKQNNIFVELRVPGLRSNKILDSKRYRKNPNNLNAGEYINTLFTDNKIFINSSCIKSKIDYINVKNDKNGNIDKSEKDTLTGGQKYGHLTDCLKYFICEYDYDEYQKYCSFFKKFVG